MRIDAIGRLRPTSASDEPRALNAVSFRDVLLEASPPTAHSSDVAGALGWSAADAEAFTVFAEANRRTESGGTATFSTLRTTAGASASYGVAQLSVREHLDRLARLSDAQLAELGTSRTEIEALRGRGEAAVAFYHLVVDRRGVLASADRLGLDGASAREIGQLAEQGEPAALIDRYGERFASATGLSREELGHLVATRALRDPAMREAFATQYAHDHGAAFDPTARDAGRMAITARHVALAHPELDAAMRTLGEGDEAAVSTAHYLGVGDSAENLLGWHAHAAATSIDAGRLEALLARADATTSHLREVEDFERALAAVARIGDLDGDARIATLARLGRAFHGSPTRTREAMFENGHLSLPRFETRAELDEALDALRSGRRWSDERLAGNVADVLAERRAS